MRVYSNSLEDKNKCAEIVVRAERLMGEMLKETVRHEGGRPKSKLTQIIKIKKRFHDVTVLPAGISKIQSHRFQKAASVPVKEFEKHLTHVRETEGGEITTNGILRLASSLERDIRAKGMKATPLTTHPHRPIYPSRPRF